MITINHVAMHQGGRLLFDEVSLQLNLKQRYALVGANGTGKSTFLHLIAGREEVSLGDILIANTLSLGWLKQDHYLYEDEVIVDVVLQGKPKLWSAFMKKNELLAETNFTEEIGFKLAECEETIANLDGYAATAKAHKLLVGLGISHTCHDKKLNTLSGGYKIRVLMAQLLFQHPDILLLDEPTNHLDIVSISWLEKYLREEFRGILIFVSHDINFMNKLATKVLDIDYGEIREYTGNYNHFIEQKDLIMAQKLQQKAYLDKKIAMMQRFVERFRSKPSKARQAMSRKRMIDKIELPDITQSSRRRPHINFEPKRSSGKNVISISNLSKAFDDNIVLFDLTLSISRGEKVAIIGHNGVGKSTLLKIITGELQADDGNYEWGHEAHVSYFAQDHREALETDENGYYWLSNQIAKTTDSELRKTLGSVLFSKDDSDKPVKHLSGGESARLIFAKLMLQKPNTIILDEPNNHLDIETNDALISALKKFSGTIVLVSHDRFFVSKVASRIIAFGENGKVTDFKGSYADYLAKFGDDYLSKDWLIANG